VGVPLLGISVRNGMRVRSLVAIILAAAGVQTAWAQVEDASSSQIQIVSPVDGINFEAKANVPLKIQGMDVPDVGHVIQLLENGMVIHSLVLDPLVPTQTQPVKFEFTFDVDDLRAGHYTFVAMIDDTSSAPVTVVVKRRHGRHR
jgi:hypothetical protein